MDPGSNLPRNAAGYLGRRDALLHEGAGSACPEDCPAHCCREAGLQVEVSLADLYAIAARTGQSPTEVFAASARVGQSSTKAGLFVRQVTLELCKPCAWQEGKRCRVHDFKPLACAMFPENIYARAESRDEYVGRMRFADYPCLQSARNVSKARRDALAELDAVLRSDFWASDLHLFACSPVFVDFSGHIEELVALGKRLMRKLGLTVESYCQRRPRLVGLYGERELTEFLADLRAGKKVFVPHEAFTAWLNTRLSNSGTAGRIREKIALLNTAASEFVDLIQSSRALVCGAAPPPGMLYRFEREEMRLVGPAQADGRLVR